MKKLNMQITNNLILPCFPYNQSNITLFSLFQNFFFFFFSFYKKKKKKT
jgi:hypothetical protein